MAPAVWLSVSATALSVMSVNLTSGPSSAEIGRHVAEIDVLVESTRTFAPVCSFGRNNDGGVIPGGGG
ncbi:hypothetical protein NIIDNTM18_24060 [Mycolicibacterium litorale]|uniref:Secreted protein n=1 Tax=Mycolicibacterium litorale TaxID=758802 RepID=A0A6S6PA62_9MYCO|nr:hypothetical protein NIIDNTM18_24060 [Mycolicibacterium litorale]